MSDSCHCAQNATAISLMKWANCWFARCAGMSAPVRGRDVGAAETVVKGRRRECAQDGDDVTP